MTSSVNGFGRLFVAGAGILALAACSDGEGGGGGGTGWTKNAPRVTSPCETIDLALVEDMFNQKFEHDDGMTIDKSDDGGGIVANCSYTSVDDSELASMADMRESLDRAIYVTLGSYSWPNEESAKETYASMLSSSAEMFEGASAQTIGGFGDEAFTIDHHLAAMTVREGTLVFTVNVTQGRKHLTERETAIMQKLLAAY